MLVTVHSGAQAELDVQPPAPLANEPLSAVTSTCVAWATAGRAAAAAMAATSTGRRVREWARMTV